MNNQGKRRGKKEERTRVYLFAGCFPAKQKYLPIFAVFCEYAKNAICKCFLSYSVD